MAPSNQESAGLQNRRCLVFWQCYTCDNVLQLWSELCSSEKCIWSSKKLGLQEFAFPNRLHSDQAEWLYVYLSKGHKCYESCCVCLYPSMWKELCWFLQNFSTPKIIIVPSGEAQSFISFSTLAGYPWIQISVLSFTVCIHFHLKKKCLKVTD